ncbi:hypothetical protein BD410DRAFT_797800 [Rickenella mellea]|uniref:Uncharacterized protein n=1 Tax=Rickenella mellea TaxID=50990 RepID=A0A4R5XDI9_9AGAM|nr:hypothetical protein BD410DRAFT_797800 [Rickenella mellea]
MTEFPHCSFSQRRSNTRQTVPPFPSFSLVLLGRSHTLRKPTRTPVVQSVAGWSMTTFDYHPEPVYADAHNTESTFIRQTSALDDGTLQTTEDDSSEISILDFGEQAPNLIRKIRYMMVKTQALDSRQACVDDAVAFLRVKMVLSERTSF